MLLRVFLANEKIRSAKTGDVLNIDIKSYP